MYSYLLCALLLFAVPVHHAPSKEVVEIELIIRNNKSPKGEFVISFYNNPGNFPKVGRDVLTEKIEVKDTLPHHIKVKVPGDTWYAIAMFQDEDGKPKIKQDVVGIPMEPYGFSNNIHPKVAAPTFEMCRFYVGLAENNPIDISLIQPKFQVK